MLSKFRWSRTFVPLVALSLAVSACEYGADGLTGPSGPALSTTTTEYRLVRGSDGTSSKYSVLVDGEGAMLSYAGHSLYIPAGAVSGPTVFTFQLISTDHVVVRMTATSQGSTVENDVGSKGFAKALALELDYQTLTEQLNASNLVVLWAKADGTFERQADAVDEGRKKIRSSIWHFSDYGIGVPADEETT